MAQSSSSGNEEGSRLKIQNANMDNRSLDNLNNAKGLTPVDSHPLMELSPTGSADSIEYAPTTTTSMFPDLVPPIERNHNDGEPITTHSTKKKAKPTSLQLDVVRGGTSRKTVPILFATSSTESEGSNDLSQFQATVGPSMDTVALSSKVSKESLMQRSSAEAPQPDSSSPETPSPVENGVPSPGSSIFGDIEPPQQNTADRSNWVKVTLPDGKCREIDMKVIEPYKRILSHGGYYNKQNAIIVFSSCFLPDRSRSDYHYVMANLFLYVIKTLQQLITEDYVLIYFHGGSNKNNVPPFRWLKKCYQLIDRRLRKSLKAMYLVHPSFWLKSMVWMLRPFVSTKFWRKMVYVQTLDELYKFVNVEKAAVPDKVKQYDHKHS